MSLVKVQSEPNLVKDSVSKAIINTDTNGYYSYKQQREQMLANRNKMFEYENQIRSLTDEVCSIKETLINILNRVK
jgi:hypothetical protein